MAAKGPSPHVTAAEVRLHPLLDALRGHPRFVALQAKLDADPRFTPTPKRTAATMTEGKSVAVLPFANQSGGSDDSFADGISEELGIVLCKVPGLRVAGWSSALSFKGKNVPEAEIARQLGVTHIVGGTVSRSGTQIVIRARLVNAADGFQVWADRFTPEAKDIFAVQDEIAGQIAEKLQLKLGVDARRTRAVNPEAHRLVLEGRHFWNRRNEEGFARAEAAFLKAIELDPNFAEAHVGLAGVYAIRADYQPVSGRSAAVAADVARARRAAERAVDLGEQLAEANAVLAYAHMIQGEQDAAGRRFASALALNPQSPMIILWQAVWHTANGRIDAALENHARVQSIDPLWFINLHLQAEALFYAGRLVEALALNERATGLRSDVFVPSLGLRAQTLFALGRREEALEAARSVRKILSSDTRWHADAAAIRVIKLCGEEAEARAYAEEWLRDEARERVVRPIVLAALGRGEDAMAELVDLRMSQRRGLFWDPIWDPWRADPRFEAVLVRLGCLAEYRTARTTQARLQAERKEPSR
jgi:TolB-like protein